MRPSPRLVLASLSVLVAFGATACSSDPEPTASTPVSTSDAPASVPTSVPTSEPTTPEPTTDPTSATPTETPTPTDTATPEPTPTEPPVDPDSPPTTYDAARARFDAQGQEPVDLMRFRTPQGIYCLLDSDFAIGCELPRLKGIPDPDFCGEGPSQSIGRVTFGLDGGGPNPECNSDTIRETGARRIPIGSVAGSAATGIVCLVEEIGVTCLDPRTTRGFFLGREAYTTFNAG